MTALDHVNVKLFAKSGSQVNWQELIPVFHRWIRENVLPGTLIDVADYAHVPEGPGVLLIAQDAFYSVDNRGNEPGFLYNRRTVFAGSLNEKVREAYDSAIAAAQLLEQESDVSRNLKFDRGEFEIFVNDRLLAANTEETEKAFRPVVEALYRERFSAPPEIMWENKDPRSLFRLRVRRAG